MPITPEAGSYTRYGRRSPWRRWFPVIAALGLLLLAPLIAHAQGQDSVVVRWAAPGDDGNVGTATAFDLRVSQAPITAANFAQALSVPGLPAPVAAGGSQNVTVYGLTGGTIYYFALKTVDDLGNWSSISNVARWDWNLDTAPPSSPSGVRAQRETGSVQVNWNANSEPDLAGYHVYRRLNGGAAVRLTGSLVSSEQYIDGSAPDDGTPITYEVTAVDINGNESAHSAGVSPTLAAGTSWAVQPAYPNPSAIGQSVTIPVVIAPSVSGDVTVEVRDTGGHLVRRLVVPNPLPGLTQVVWDGKNDAGRDTAPGVYRGWLVAGDTRSSARILRRP